VEIMEPTAIAILAGVVIFTLILWAMMIFMGKRQTWMIIFTIAMTLLTILVALNTGGYIDIWPILTPPAAGP